MMNMMRADLYRIVRGKAIYIAFAIMIFMIAMSIYMVSPGSLGISVGQAEAVQENLGDMTYEEFSAMGMKELRKFMLKTKGYELDRDILAHNINLYYVFIFVAAIAVTVDFSGSSIKNTLSCAISRRKYFLSKLIFTAIACIILFFLNTYIVYFSNIIFNNENLASSLGAVTRISVLQILPVLALVSILNGFAFVLKRTAVFNTVTIPFFMVVPSLASMAIKIFHIPEKYFNYELQAMFVRLANNPSDGYVLRSFFVCAVIIVGCNLIGYLTFKKAEIK